MRASLVTFAFFLSSLTLGCATAAKAEHPFMGVDLYGTSRPGVFDEIQRKHGTRISEFVQAEDPKRAHELRKEIAALIRNEHGFADVDLSMLTYFQPSARYLTIDVVERADAARRMPFLPSPTGRFEDPEGLLALWVEYSKIGFELLAKGELKDLRACPAWHCTLGFNHPLLAKYAPIFAERVPRAKAKLVEILRGDADEYRRGNASYLLAHIPDGRELAELQLPSVYDSSSFARNSVIRVFSALASKPEKVDVPLEPFLRALNFPATTDRNKAGAVLETLSKNPRHHARIARDAGSVLIAMLRLKQPNNHDPAYVVLKNISGRAYGERDYAAWEKWLAEAAARDTR